MNPSETIAAAARALKSADAILVGAGAGMGVDSGLPDFRGPEGFWRAYPPMRDRGIDFASMANPKWFRTEPRLAWGFYGHRLNLYRAVEPHAGFAALRAIIGRRPRFVFTSNVDGQFQKAGFDPGAVVEIHGSIHWMQDLDGHGALWPAEGVEVKVDEQTFLADTPLPTDPRGKLARPNILMFGDWHWDSSRSDAQHVRYAAWRRAATGGRLVVVEIGGGTALPSVRMESEGLQRTGATVIRINPREPFGPPGTLSLPMGGKAGLTALAKACRLPGF